MGQYHCLDCLMQVCEAQDTCISITPTMWLLDIKAWRVQVSTQADQVQTEI